MPRIPLPHPARTHEVEGSLVVADDHEGPLQLQLLGAPHPHPDAVEALEGQERGAQEPAKIGDEIRQRDTSGEGVCTGLSQRAGPGCGCSAGAGLGHAWISHICSL